VDQLEERPEGGFTNTKLFDPIAKSNLDLHRETRVNVIKPRTTTRRLISQMHDEEVPVYSQCFVLFFWTGRKIHKLTRTQNVARGVHLETGWKCLFRSKLTHKTGWLFLFKPLGIWR